MSQSTNSAAKPVPRQPKGKQTPWILVLLYRLILLGLGSVGACALGVVLANRYPRTNPEKPLIVGVIERKLASSTPSQSVPVSIPASPSNKLTPVQKKQVQEQLKQLQGQVKSLSDRTTTLEKQLGTQNPDQPLENRLQALSQQLDGKAVIPATNAPNTSNQGDLKATLPSDALFGEKDSILLPEAGTILDKVVADLRTSPGSTIRIAAHTDGSGDANANRELSYRRAKAVEQYFSRSLGNKYHWLAIGYGETRRLVPNSTKANLQRNRRIEISVE